MNSAAKRKIFLSYRRSDSNETVGRLFDRLADAFGSDSVFRDVTSIEAGADFREVIGNAIGHCHVLIVLIGPNWFEDRKVGSREIDQEYDFVREEVRAGLERGVRIIPVLHSNAAMPEPSELPESIRRLSYLNALPLRTDPDFEGDVGRLIDNLSKTIRPSLRKPFAVSAFAIILLLATVAWFILRPVKLTVPIKCWVGYTPLAVASAMNLYPQDVNVELVDTESVSEMFRDMSRGDLDVALTPIDFLVRKCVEDYTTVDENMERPVAILWLDTSRGADGVVARNGIKTIDDLWQETQRGRKFLYQQHDVSHFLIRCMYDEFNRAHPDLPKRHFREIKNSAVPVTPEGAAQKFKSEPEWIAAGTYEPFLTKILDSESPEFFVPGATILVDSDSPEVNGLVIDLMITKESILDDKGDALKSLMVGWFAAVERLSNPNHPQHMEAIDHARRFNGDPLGGLDWSIKTWTTNKSCGVDEWKRIVDGLRGRTRPEAEKVVPWPTREDNIAYFKQPGNSDSQFHKNFDACKQLMGTPDIEEVRANVFDKSKVFFNSDEYHHNIP